MVPMVLIQGNPRETMPEDGDGDGDDGDEAVMVAELVAMVIWLSLFFEARYLKNSNELLRMFSEFM